MEEAQLQEARDDYKRRTSEATQVPRLKTRSAVSYQVLVHSSVREVSSQHPVQVNKHVKHVK